jgi:hypothetical protein
VIACRRAPWEGKAVKSLVVHEVVGRVALRGVGKVADSVLSSLWERHDERAQSACINLDQGGAKPIQVLFDLEEMGR